MDDLEYRLMEEYHTGCVWNPDYGEVSDYLRDTGQIKVGFENGEKYKTVSLTAKGERRFKREGIKRHPIMNIFYKLYNALY